MCDSDRRVDSNTSETITHVTPRQSVVDEIHSLWNRDTTILTISLPRGCIYLSSPCDGFILQITCSFSLHFQNNGNL